MKLATCADMEAYLLETEASLREGTRDPGVAASSRVMLAVWPAFFRAFDAEIRNRTSPQDMLFIVHTVVLNILEHVANTCAEDEYRAQTAMFMLERLRLDLMEVMAGFDPPGFRIVPVKPVPVS